MAVSLKEMSEVPGGEFRTFWEPEYRMSMPVERGGRVLLGAKLSLGRDCRGGRGGGPRPAPASQTSFG